MYPVTLKRGEPPMLFPNRRDMVAWLLHNLTSSVVLIVGPMYYLDAHVVGGVVLDLLEDSAEDAQCWAVTASGYHRLMYRDADGCMIADVGQPKDDYRPGERDDKKRENRTSKGDGKRLVQKASNHKRDRGKRSRGRSVGKALGSAQPGEHLSPGGDCGSVRAETPSARGRT